MLLFAIVLYEHRKWTIGAFSVSLLFFSAMPTTDSNLISVDFYRLDVVVVFAVYDLSVAHTFILWLVLRYTCRFIYLYIYYFFLHKKSVGLVLRDIDCLYIYIGLWMRSMDTYENLKCDDGNCMVMMIR